MTTPFNPDDVYEAAAQHGYMQRLLWRLKQVRARRERERRADQLLDRAVDLMIAESEQIHREMEARR